ncbi:class I SAM-dependent methyltransferase [Nocardia sp. BMG51109]|uniref:class I SAM-dependent methyltransferase n=1 Tax=Nocardia sp. BMG51109 TaxID=1056816 RepID=UPI000463E583|nr:class I SAM-dependent methyltransferase [Nocardia sp. BMG51109]
MSETGEPNPSHPELWARRANSFGAEAGAYAAHRPDYPLAGIRWALEPLGATAEPEVLDLAAGTGKLTDGLIEVGARVTAVEPDDAMRAEFARRHPRPAALAGSAESIPLPADSVDAVLVGQAFHWFDPPRAFPEIARVLRPGGVLAAFWNMHDSSVEWVAELDRLSRTEVLTRQRSRDPDPAHPLFAPFRRQYFPHTQRRTAESLAATVGTHSHALVLDSADRAALLARIAEYLRGRPETRSGEFDLPLRTLVVRTTPR